jgi:sugar lactone lactonase YvrE
MATLPHPATLSVSPADVTARTGSPVAAWHLADGLPAPTGVAADDATKHLFVSNADGTVARLTADGRPLALRWADGLDAPAGLRAARGHLVVACRTAVVVLDLASGAVVRRIPVPGAVALADVAADANGTVYAADPAAGAVFAIDEDRVAVFADGDLAERPSGLLAVGNQLFVAGAGEPRSPGRLFALNLRTREKTPITPGGVGRLVGLAKDERCQFLSADRAAGAVFRVSPRGEATLVVAGLPDPGGLAYLPDRRLLVVTRPADHAVTAFDLSKR